MNPIDTRKVGVAAGASGWTVDESSFRRPNNRFASATAVEVFDETKGLRLKSAFAKQRRLARRKLEIRSGFRHD